MRNFKEYPIWIESMVLVKKVYQLNFPKEEIYGLRSQMTRAAVSISSNIAEGASRRSTKDFARFLEIALGSAYELETQLIISKELNYFNGQDLANMLAELTQIQKMLYVFIKRVREE